MAQRAMRPPNLNPLAPRTKVHKLTIDPDIATWLLFAGITIALCIELAVFASKEHAALDVIVAWTGLAWFTTIAIACIRIFSASKTAYPGP